MVIVRAIFDYNGSADHRIRFVKGDTFELVDDTDPNWWHVTLPRTQELEIPEHIYVPATYVVKVEEGPNGSTDDLPPPPTDEELATISSTDLTGGKTQPSRNETMSVWRAHVDTCGKTYYFNVETQTSQWKKPDELKAPKLRRRVSLPRSDEQHYASLLPKGADGLRKSVNAAAAHSNYVNMGYDSSASPHYANLGGEREYTRPSSLQTTGQTTCSENTRRDRKHSSPSPAGSGRAPVNPRFTPAGPDRVPTSPGFTPAGSGRAPASPGTTTSPANGSVLGESVSLRQEKRATSPRPYSVAVTSSSIPATPTRPHFKRQMSDVPLSPPRYDRSTTVPVFNRRSTKKNSFKSRQLSSELHDSVVTTSVDHGNSSFHDNTITISAPHPTTIPKQILEGYAEDRIGDDTYYICKNTNEKWKLVINPGDDKTHYFNPLTGERVWTLPVYKAVNRTFSNPSKPKNTKGLDKRSKSLSDYGRSPVIKCEGTVKRKITKAPPEVKSVEKSWASFYTVLKSNTVYFYKDIKHFKRNEFESACDLTSDVKVDLEADKKGMKLIKISKENGLQMLLRVKAETGVKSTTFEAWLENLSASAGTPYQGMKGSLSTSDLSPTVDNSNGYTGDVDTRSIIDCKEITKKDINDFLNRKMKSDTVNKSSIQKLLEDQGIDISHLDKSKKREVLTKLLSSRPSFTDLEKKGLIKYTVFGCPLAKLCARQKVAVPSVITQCIEAIEGRGLKSSGMYRISGNSASIQKLRFKVDREEHVNLKDEEFDINMLTGFFKLFLRELPEPIIPFNQYPVVESAIRNGEGGYADTLLSLKHVVHDLPEPNKSTFKYIILHLVRVAHEEENQMDEHNLSIIFGPSLLGNHPDKANLLVDLPIQNTAIEKIINNYRTIFK